MVAEKALQMLLKGMANLENSGDHADLMITCGSDVYKVHKAIVCSQSEFFHLACRKHTDAGGNFKEAQSGIVEIPSCKIDVNTSEPDDFKWNADADDPKCVKLMIHYFYHLDYLEVETAKLKEKKRFEENFDETHILKEGLLIDHAKMYVMGDKYGIFGLKDLALRKYQEAYEHTSAGFANSMIVIYTSTIDNDMDLRNVIIKILTVDITNLMSKPKISQNVKDLPLLSHVLLRKQLKLSV
ncbi:hypothetical protein E4T52_06342 [Aureobasidium sp. EXF-3400]|nr:hypothetical protein E4T51_05430 [Aureobasidium sp. EXF-12344]KAI4778708.1 hypothetical protein E4T52_06342 [Aureobasidium sp. EXF-3400]